MVVATVVVTTVVDMAPLHVTIVLAMIALAMVLATPLVVAVAMTLGERQAAGAQQGESEKQAGDE
jgi:hypothetical protein